MYQVSKQLDIHVPLLTEAARNILARRVKSQHGKVSILNLETLNMQIMRYLYNFQWKNHPSHAVI